MNDDRCQTCKHWDQRYPKNKHLGVCLLMGVINYKNEAALSMNSVHDSMPPVSDVDGVRTLSTFGCVRHQPRVE